MGRETQALAQSAQRYQLKSLLLPGWFPSGSHLGSITHPAQLPSTLLPPLPLFCSSKDPCWDLKAPVCLRMTPL